MLEIFFWRYRTSPFVAEIVAEIHKAMYCTVLYFFSYYSQGTDKSRYLFTYNDFVSLQATLRKE